MTTLDGPLITLCERPGYPYPLPPDTKLRSLDPASETLDMGRMNIVQWPQVQLDGKTIRIFKTVARPPAALIIPVDDDGRIMLVDTQQPGSAPYQGFIAGDLDPRIDHDLGQGARRELLEETGYEATWFHVVYFHYFTPRWEWFAYTIIAQGCRRVTEPKLDPGELCRPFFVTIDELIGMTREEKFLYPPVMVEKLLMRDEEDKLRRLLLSPYSFSAKTFQC